MGWLEFGGTRMTRCPIPAQAWWLLKRRLRQHSPHADHPGYCKPSQQTPKSRFLPSPSRSSATEGPCAVAYLFWGALHIRTARWFLLKTNTWREICSVHKAIINNLGTHSAWQCLGQNPVEPQACKRNNAQGPWRSQMTRKCNDTITKPSRKKSYSIVQWIQVKLSMSKKKKERKINFQRNQQNSYI